MRLVTDQLARLDQEADRAQRQADRWEQIAVGLDAQRTAHWAEELRSLPVNDAARRIGAKRAEQEQQQRPRAAQRERQLRDPFERDPHRADPGRDGPARGL